MTPCVGSDRQVEDLCQMPDGVCLKTLTLLLGGLLWCTGFKEHEQSMKKLQISTPRPRQLVGLSSVGPFTSLEVER